MDQVSSQETTVLYPGTKYDKGNFTPTTYKQLWDQKSSVGIWLIKPTEPSDPLNFETFFKHCILKTVLHIFLLFVFVWNKIFYSKNLVVFYISDLV